MSGRAPSGGRRPGEEACRYGKLCTIVYDLDKPQAPAEEIGVYTQFVKSKSEKILEPMCGSGRFLIPLIERGYDVEGFDLSPEMLVSCKKRCAALGLSPRLFLADVRTFEAPVKYRYAFIPFGSLSLVVGDADFSAAMARIRHCLRENGVFVFSFLGPDTSMEESAEWRETMNFPLGDKRIACLQRAAFHPREAVWDVKLRYEIRRGGEVLETEDQDFPIKLRDDDSVIAALERAGFTAIEAVTGVPLPGRFRVFMCVAG